MASEVAESFDVSAFFDVHFIDESVKQIKQVKPLVFRKCSIAFFKAFCSGDFLYKRRFNKPIRIVR